MIDMVSDNASNIFQQMTIDNWINVAVAIGTISLAIVASIAIRQTAKAHKREIRERIINDVISWANSVIKCRLSPSFELRSVLALKDSKDWEILYWGDTLRELLDKGISLQRSTEVIWSDLSIAIDNAVNDIVETFDFVAKFVGKDKKEKRSTKEFVPFVNKQDSSARDVLNKANDIKAKLLKS